MNMFLYWCFFSSSNYWNRAHPEAPFSVRFQSHNIPFKRTSSCLSILIWTQFLTQIWGQRADGWSKKRDCGALGFALEFWNVETSDAKHLWISLIFHPMFDVWWLEGLMIAMAWASHWLAIRFERKLTHSRPRLVSRMKTRRCEQPHTMNSCKQMRNSRFFLACMSQTCIVWYVCFGGGKGRTVVIPLKLRVTERSATSLQDLHMRSKMHSTAEPLYRKQRK